MKPPPPRSPKAVIERRGRWIYEVTIEDDPMVIAGPYTAFGRRDAERCARKKLARYLRKFGPPRERWTIPAREER